MSKKPDGYLSARLSTSLKNYNESFVAVPITILERSPAVGGRENCVVSPVGGAGTAVVSDRRIFASAELALASRE